MQPNNARKIRAILVYSTTALFFVALFAYIVWSLRVLLFPIIIGALLAYIFKPLLARRHIPWLPNSVRVVMLLTFLTTGLVYGAKKIKSNIPDDNQLLVLQVRMNHKLHEKYNAIMDIDEKTGKGNFVYNVVKDDVNPLMLQLYSLLNLNKDDRRKFRKYYRAHKKTDPSLEKYYEYYRSNLKRAKIEEAALEAAKKEEQQRSPASADATNEEKASIVGSLLDTISIWLITPFVFIFLLFDNGQIKKFMVQLVPNKFFELSLTILDEVDSAIGNYLRGTILECSLVGLTIGAGLYLVGLDPKIAFAIGATAGFANAIPFLGPVIGLVVGLSYGLIVENINPILPFVTPENLFLAIFFCVVIAQLLDNTIFQPIVLGSAVNLHPLVVIIGVMGGSVMFGFAGMLLAIPAIVVFKVVTETLFREMKAYRII